ncbi:hypothetical protein [Saccharothrix sp.]|uniref:hypothetical protein n=1 Tax=Saccharothrix sp. TaxID=1873460 RepID=UPI0028117F96|nr:hypothetical protein [Saccharothrix sp.]
MGAADNGAAVPSIDQVEHQLVQRSGQFQWRTAQVELDGPVGDPLGDAVEGEAGDAAEGLGVEQQQEAGDAVDGVQRGVVEEVCGPGPSVRRRR